MNKYKETWKTQKLFYCISIYIAFFTVGIMKWLD